MTAYEVIEKLMWLDEQSCPCEANIPCPFYNEDNEASDYCDGMRECYEGMAITLKKLLKENENETDNL